MSTCMQTWDLVNGQLHNGSSPQLSKESVERAMKGAKRVIEMGPNMIFNEEIVSHYHKVETATDGKVNSTSGALATILLGHHQVRI